MDIRERRERLKDIISMIDKGIEYVEYDSMVIEEALEKIDDLFWYLEENCITSNSTNKDKFKGDVFINYFEDDSYIENIVNGIRSLTDDVEKYIDGMVEGRRKEEWEGFYDELLGTEYIINIEEQEINNIDTLIKQMDKLKVVLTDLL